MIDTPLSGQDNHAFAFDLIVAADPVVRRAEAVRLCRRALVELGIQALRSEMTNPEKLAVVHHLSAPEPVTFYAPTPDQIAQRRRELQRIAAARPTWTTEAQRFFALADDAFADIDKASMLELGEAIVDPRDQTRDESCAVASGPDRAVA